MQVKVNLTERELEGLRNQGDELQEKLYIMGFIWADKVVAKLAKAIEQPAKPVKRTKAPFGRADLKGQIEPATTITIAGEKIVTYWRFADGAKGATEPCLHCGRPLGHARLTRIGDGVRDGLGHKACGIKWIQADSLVSNNNARFMARGTTGPDFNQPWSRDDCPTWKLTDGLDYQAADAIGIALASLYPTATDATEDKQAA